MDGFTVQIYTEGIHNSPKENLNTDEVVIIVLFMVLGGRTAVAGA
jgi:hypothetical protein